MGTKERRPKYAMTAARSIPRSRKKFEVAKARSPTPAASRFTTGPILSETDHWAKE
jgi:hypothetical protein